MRRRLLSDAVTGPYDAPAGRALHDRIRGAIGHAEAAAAEALRERRSYLAAGPDPEPLCRTLRRLRNDLVMIGRATVVPLPEPIRPRLAAPASRAGWMMLRCVNRCDVGVEGEWHLARPIAEAERTRLDETPIGALTLKGNTITFTAAPHEIVTILVR